MNNKVKKIVKIESESLKNGCFSKEELLLYKVEQNKIDIILEYQKRLPILLEDNNTWVDARNLWSQLGVKSQYTDWIKQQIEDIGLEEKIDYFTISVQSQIGSTQGFKEILQYNIKVSTAKEISMVAGAKGGNTSKELKENSRLARKYFIAIEDAFKKRTNWNDGRKGSLIMCKELRGALIKYNEELVNGLPEWIKVKKMYPNEFNLLNNIIIGMSAQRYKELNGLNKNDQIRNHFNSDQLDYVERLERYDSQLINVQNIFDYEQRKKILQVEFNLISKKSVKYI